MKLIIGPIFVWLMVSATHSQTNQPAAVDTNKPKQPTIYTTPALAPGYAALTNIAKQKALVQQKIDKLRAEERVISQRVKLMHEAGQMGREQNEAEEHRRNRVQKQIDAWHRELAAWKLQEFDLRRQYKIPEDRPVKSNARPKP